MSLAFALCLLAAMFSAGVCVGLWVGELRRRRPRSLPPLDDTYRNPGSLIRSTTGVHRVP